MKPVFGSLLRGVGAAFSLSVIGAWAQTPPPQAPSATPPDAGLLMGTNRPAPTLTPNRTPSIEVQQETRPPLAVPGGVKVKVKAFRVTGSTVFAESTLRPLLDSFVGKDLDLAGLDEAASVISQFYRDNGYFVARAYLPAQEVAAGTIEIAVIEGRLGAIRLSPVGEVRLSQDRTQKLVAGAVPPGLAINERNVERGLMLLNDLPGMDVKSTLVPGASVGTSDLVVELTEGKLYSGSADLDNFGNKSTGTYRYGATLNVNDIGGKGDQLVLRGTTTGQGMRFVRAAYSVPLGDHGTRLGTSYTDMHYTLGGDFAASRGEGKSSVVSVYALHPFVRSRNQNMHGSLSFDSKRLRDDQLGKNTTDKGLSVLSLGVSTDSRDGFGGGGLTAGGLTYTRGRIDLAGNATYAATDAITARTAGTYDKISYNLSRLQHVTDGWSLYGSLNGQLSNGNLDSSEKLVLGGFGVRAYPQGEAAADEGYVINLEARYNVPGFPYGSLQLTAFYDTGHVRLHHQTWTGWQPTGLPGYPNSYSLSGAGFGLNLYKDADFSVRSSLAWKVGSNPGADALGRDSDNANRRSARFWVQATKQF